MTIRQFWVVSARNTDRTCRDGPRPDPVQEEE